MFSSWFDTLNRENAALRSQLAYQRAENEQLRLLLAERPSKNGSALNPPDTDHLRWIYARLIAVHGEKPSLDYMLKLDKIIRRMEGAQGDS